MIKIVFKKELNKSIAYHNDESIGECEFVEEGNVWNIAHTWVYQDYQGQGIAKRLVKSVIEQASANNKRLRATCSYAQKVLDSKN